MDLLELARELRELHVLYGNTLVQLAEKEGEIEGMKASDRKNDERIRSLRESVISKDAEIMRLSGLTKTPSEKVVQALAIGLPGVGEEITSELRKNRKLAAIGVLKHAVAKELGFCGLREAEEVIDHWKYDEEEDLPQKETPLAEVWHVISSKCGAEEPMWPEDYRKVADVQATSCEVAFHLTNNVGGELWSCNKEVKKIYVSNLRSTSIGDVVMIEGSPRRYQNAGWEDVPDEIIDF